MTIAWGKGQGKWEKTGEADAFEAAEEQSPTEAVEYWVRWEGMRPDMTEAAGESNPAKTIYVTLTGLPLSIRLEWPFRQSNSGADFWVLHGDVRLESAEGLHAPVSVNLSATVREVLPSLEPKDAMSPVINALRTEVDRRQVEFVKSGKLVPVNFSSRHYDFKRNQWVFGKASDEAIATFLERRIFWQTRLVGGDVFVGDPTEAQYLQCTADHVVEIANQLAGRGLVKLERRYATAQPDLMARAEEFESAARTALEELEKKHAFERG